MAMDVKTLMKRFLGQLNADKLKELIWHLTLADADGLSDIPPAELPEGSTRQNVVDRIVETHEDDAIIITCKQLKEIGQNYLATSLEKKAATLGLRIAPVSSGPAAAPGASHPANVGASRTQHFVDEHRDALIQRVSMVAPILDGLLTARVVTLEGYNLVRSERTPQDQMRALYNGPLNSCGNRGKDIFYKILVETHGFLVEDLKAPSA